MVHSMTGFARDEIQLENLDLVIELRGVNNRYLDVICKLPESFSFFEEAIKELIRTKLGRGRVEVRLKFKDNSSQKTYMIDKEALHNLIAQGQQVASEANFTAPKNLEHFLQIPGIVVEEPVRQDDKELKKAIIPKIEKVINDFINMRQSEGARLKEDILQRLNLISNKIIKIEGLAENMTDDYRDKLKKKIEKLNLDGVDLDENRLMMEVAIFAERSSITEELVRLNSHLKEFENTLNQTGTIGRKLDFIVQEINRETNTIGSKSHSYDINKLVVDIKGETEKIREQIQNIE
ncbi:YicC/YloC family endoribonuclease [Proteinivorax hydrogeniformans]|uniref:YicC/YloC family endoribonuclease n=1 Tax=Proteinivorax hydrogeniformans TaxID=1826727 RepID=A0AAU8HPK0_9FIRM